MPATIVRNHPPSRGRRLRAARREDGISISGVELKLKFAAPPLSPPKLGGAIGGGGDAVGAVAGLAIGTVGFGDGGEDLGGVVFFEAARERGAVLGAAEN